MDETGNYSGRLAFLGHATVYRGLVIPALFPRLNGFLQIKVYSVVIPSVTAERTRIDSLVVEELAFLADMGACCFCFGMQLLKQRVIGKVYLT